MHKTQTCIREGCWAHLFQALGVVGLAIPFLMPLIISSSSILIFLHQDPVVARIAEQYLIASLPGLLFICIFEACRKFLIYHRDYPLQTIASVLTIPIQTLLLHIFVGELRLGAEGAGHARSATTFIVTLILLLYIIIRRESYGWTAYLHPTRAECQPPPDVVAAESSPGSIPQRVALYTNAVTGAAPVETAAPQAEPSEVRSSCDCCTTTTTSEANSNAGSTSKPSLYINNLLEHESLVKIHQHWWQGMLHFFKIAVPSTFLCVFEWVAFEVQIFVAAYLGPVELSAIASSAALSTLFFILSLSVAVTVNGEIGRAMGSRKPKDAYTLAKAGCVASACISLPIAVFTLSFREFIARFYSATAEIRVVIVRNLFFQSAVVIVDSLHAILGGVVKALNLQKIGCIFDAIGLLGIMQVVGISIAFNTSLLGSGFLIGTIVGVSSVLVGYGFLLFKCTDWEAKSIALVGRKAAAGPIEIEK